MKKILLLSITLLTMLMADLTLVGKELTPVSEAVPPAVPSGEYTVIPGVYGFGTNTRAAYGGTVDPVILHVNTLASGVSNTDSTHGSFAWAVTRNYPRVVVFDVSGVINGVGSLDIKDPYLTIAGQTAPDHIIFNGEGLYLLTNDIVIQHMTFRNKYTANKDCITIYPYAGQNVTNVVIDHISASWATDELIDASQTASYPSGNYTISNSILANPIYDSSGSSGILTNGNNVSFIGNFFAHINKRHPALNDYARIAFFNNVIYNYGYAIAEFNGLNNATETPVDKMWLNFIGNVIKSGANSNAGRGLVKMDLYAENTTNEISMRDNIHNGVTKTGLDIDTSDFNWDYTEVPEIVIPNYTPIAASLTEALVLANAGARPADRDSVDTAAINDFINGTGSRPTSTPSMPSYTRTTSAFVPVANPHAMYDEHYTNLEHQLHQLAAALEQ